MEGFTRITNNGRYFLSHTICRKRDKSINIYNSLDTLERELKRKISNNNLNVGFESKGISENTAKKIKIRCRVLSYSAEIKEVKDWQNNVISHKTSFITLTLPSLQIHTDQQITKEILGKFLDRCRKIGLLNNYVWKAEKQKNKNIHYHILTDSYCNKTIVYRYWLLACNSLGYVDRYTEKFAGMSLLDYKKLSFNVGKSDAKIGGQYWKGNKNKWRLPPCYDSINVVNDNSIEKYLSKYMSKDENGENLKVSGRSWGCSNGINKAVEIFKNDYDFNNFGYNIVKYTLKCKEFAGDFFTVLLRPITSFFAWFPESYFNIVEKLRVAIIPCKFHERLLWC